MSQADVARQLGTSQNAIYRLENPKYGRPNISTLKKAASFFDVGVIVRFASFSEIADWTTGLSEISMDVPDFDHDTGFIVRKPLERAGVPLVASAQGGISLDELSRQIQQGVFPSAELYGDQSLSLGQMMQATGLRGGPPVEHPLGESKGIHLLIDNSVQQGVAPNPPPQTDMPAAIPA